MSLPSFSLAFFTSSFFLQPHLWGHGLISRHGKVQNRGKKSGWQKDNILWVRKLELSVHFHSPLLWGNIFFLFTKRSCGIFVLADVGISEIQCCWLKHLVIFWWIRHHYSFRKKVIVVPGSYFSWIPCSRFFFSRQETLTTLGEWAKGKQWFCTLP